MDKIAIVILSCFKYRFIWEVVINSWERELKNSHESFDIYITTDNPGNLDISSYLKSHNAELIEYANNISWSKAFIDSVEKIEGNNYKKIITTFDDLLITNIRIDLLRHLLKNDKKSNYHKLINNHSSFFKRTLPFREFEINKPINYLGSMVMTLWDYDFLLAFLRKYKRKLSPLNAWQFERYVPELLYSFSDLKYQNKNIVSYTNLMIKGKLDMFSLIFYKFTKNENLDNIYLRYAKLNLIENTLIYIYYILFNTINLFFPKTIINIFIRIKRFFKFI